VVPAGREVRRFSWTEPRVRMGSCAMIIFLQRPG
jgi:hypothetical protein